MLLKQVAPAASIQGAGRRALLMLQPSLIAHSVSASGRYLENRGPPVAGASRPKAGTH
jgi:hypothetical protein